MADITIIRNGARISLANFPKLGSGSENISVAVSASGAYDTYTTELYYGWYQGSSMQKMIAKYQNGLYYIPANALFNAGNVYLTLRLVSGGNKVSTNTIPITIEKSAVNNEYSILPATETWQNAVDYYINNANSLLNARIDSLNEALKKAVNIPSDKFAIVDTSLSISGAGADAKVVGDKFDKINGAEESITFTLSPSNAHSSKNDQLYIKGDIGETIYVHAYSLDGNPVQGQIIAYNNGVGTDTQITVKFFNKNDFVKFELKNTIDSVGLYLVASKETERRIIFRCSKSLFSSMLANDSLANKKRDETDSNVYLANKGMPNIVENIDGSVTLELKEGINIRGQKINNMSLETIVEQLPDNATLENGVCKIKIKAFYVLAYDLDTSKLFIAYPDNSFNKKRCIVLLKVGYALATGLFSNYRTYSILQSFDKTKVDLSDVQKNAFVSSYNTLDTVNWKIHAKEFSKLFNNTNYSEGFLFFTDSHIFDERNAPKTWETNANVVFSWIEQMFYASPCSFVLSGGDWLGAFDSQASALQKLSYISGMMRKKFPNKYVMLIGNHDTNYQGYIEEEAQGKNPDDVGHGQNGRLSQGAIDATYMCDFKKSYYKYDAKTFRMYCFDTGIESDNLSSKYYQDQVNWFASEIKNDKSKHIVLALHIIKDDAESETSYHEMFIEVSKCANAFNNRQSYTYNGVTYDYSNLTGAGKVAFAIAGHSHADKIGTYNSIPYVLSVNTTGYGSYSTIPIDLMCIDWDNAKLKAYRASTTTDNSIREVDIIV